MSELGDVERELRLMSALDVSVRQRAARRLVELGAPEAHFALHYRLQLERDLQTRTVLQTSVAMFEEQCRLQPSPRFLRDILATIRPVLDSKTPEPTAHAAALRTVDFLEKRSPDIVRTGGKPGMGIERSVTSFPNITLMSQTSLPDLVNALLDPCETQRRRVEGALLQRGSEATASLVEAFGRTIPLHQARIAGVLASIGDVAALPVIWIAWQRGMEVDTHVSLKSALLRIGSHLSKHHRKISPEKLLSILTDSRELLPQLTDYVIEALERMAKENPTQELRTTIPVLKGSLFHPATAAMARARRAIEAATKDWAQLPIASVAPDIEQADDLPIPARQQAAIVAATLPLVRSDTDTGCR